MNVQRSVAATALFFYMCHLACTTCGYDANGNVSIGSNSEQKQQVRIEFEVMASHSHSDTLVLAVRSPAA